MPGLGSISYRKWESQHSGAGPAQVLALMGQEGAGRVLTVTLEGSSARRMFLPDK